MPSSQITPVIVTEADQLKHAKQPSDACHLYSTPLSAAHLFSDTRCFVLLLFSFILYPYRSTSE